MSQSTATVVTEQPVTQAVTLQSQYDLFDDASDAGSEVAAAASQPTVAKPTQKAKTDAPQKPTALTKRAEALGLSASFIERATTEELAETVVEMLSMRQAPSVPEPVQSPRPTAPQPEPEPEFDWGEIEEDGRKRKVTDEDIHEPIVKAFKKQQKEIAALKRALEERDSRAQAAVEQTFEQRLDAAFSANEKLFGKGRGEDLKKAGAPAFFRRKAVFEAIQAIPVAERAKMTIEQAIAQVSEDLFGPQVAAAATQTQTKPKAPAVTDWNNGAVATPTQRKGPPDNKPGRSKAVESVTEMLREAQTDDSSTDLEGFLD